MQTDERNENKRMEMQIEVDLICVFCSFDFDGPNPPRRSEHGKNTQTQWQSGLIQFMRAITVAAIQRQMILCVVGKQSNQSEYGFNRQSAALVFALNKT